jgi:spermidine synthase
MDVFTCGAEFNGMHAVEFLRRELHAEVFVSGAIPRGVPSGHLFNSFGSMVAPAFAVQEVEMKTRRNEAMNAPISQVYAEMLTPVDYSVMFPDFDSDYGLVIEEVQSQYQLISFRESSHTNFSDLCLVLDGTIQICKSYMKHYSEVYVHLPVAYLDKFETALIIGGGDAMALEEVLKYKSLKRVVQLELDRMVPEQCERFFNVNAHLPGSSHADPRVEWRFGDAAQTLKDLVGSGERFDIILLDISETGPSGTVSTVDFFAEVSEALSARGIFVKNEHYQEPTAILFNHFLEVKYPVPVIAQQVFVLGSNQTSLFHPSFKVWDQNNITTTFLAHGPRDAFRQLQSMVRRYSRKDIDYQSDMAIQFEKTNNRSVWSFEESEQCSAVLMLMKMKMKLVTGPLCQRWRVRAVRGHSSARKA